MKVYVKQAEDFHFVGVGDFGKELPIDAAAYVGGKGRGFRPPELLFQSLAGCVGIHLYEALIKDGKSPRSIEIETDAERVTDSYPKVFKKIFLKVKLSGNLSIQDVESAMKKTIFDPGTCSIAYMINQIAPIEYSIELKE